MTSVVPAHVTDDLTGCYEGRDQYRGLFGPHSSMKALKIPDTVTQAESAMKKLESLGVLSTKGTVGPIKLAGLAASVLKPGAATGWSQSREGVAAPDPDARPDERAAGTLSRLGFWLPQGDEPKLLHRRHRSRDGLVGQCARGNAHVVFEVRRRAAEPKGSDVESSAAARCRLGRRARSRRGRLPEDLGRSRM